MIHTRRLTFSSSIAGGLLCLLCGALVLGEAMSAEPSANVKVVTPAQQGSEAQPPATPPAPAPAPTEPVRPSLPEIEGPVANLTATVETIEKAVERSFDDEAELAALRPDIEGLIAGAELLRAHFAPGLTAVRSQIEKLGPAPGAEGSGESAQVKGERQRLSAIAAEIDGAIKTAGLVEERARQLGDRVQNRRQNMFAERVLARSKSPILPSTWRSYANELPTAGRQIGLLLTSWMRAAHEQWLPFAALLAGVLALYVLLRALIARALARRLDREDAEAPSFFARAATAGWVAPVLMIPGTVTTLLLMGGLDSLGLLVHELQHLAPTLLTSLGIVIGVSALARAILQPRRARWRLVDLETPPTRKIATTLTWIAGLYATDLTLSELARLLFLPLPVSVMVAAVTSVAIALLLFRLVRTPFTPTAATPETADATEIVATPAPAEPAATPSVPAQASLLAPRLLKLPLLALSVVIIAAVLAGYVALGRFMVSQAIATGGAVVVVLLLHLAIRALLGAPGSGVRPFSTILSERAGLSPDQGSALARAISVVLDAGLALLALPLILLTWGYTLPEALGWLKAAVFGFEIGQFRISLARILLAILLFLALVFVTRLAQRWLEASVLKSAKIDRGIANSIHTAVGYAGFVLAGLVAISYGGLDITSFAIVAGALSVGIGFGLQSIINNFVSGLILLVERPIKVGDWVAVKGQEGYVRRIAVRSTEIETSDRASLIVPNSDLITTTVTNWTHRHALGRVVIRVGVSNKSDPDKVREALTAVARECPLILHQPPPSIGFDNIAGGALEFSLRAVIPDGSRSLAVQTDLRTRIVHAFREQGILIAGAADALQAERSDAVAVRANVSLHAEPNAVRTVLERAAQETPLLRKEPAPRVTFDDIGNSALLFTIHARAADPEHVTEAESELRARALAAMKSAGLEPQHPQHDIHLRDLDRLWALLSAAAAERAAGANGGDAPKKPATPQRDELTANVRKGKDRE